MGMYDTIEVVGKHAEKIKCAAGHSLHDLQTKDLQEMLWYYRITDTGLELVTDIETNGEVSELARSRELIEGERARLKTFTGAVSFYAACQHVMCACRAFGARTGKDGVRIADKDPSTFRPHCEWVALFSMGVLLDLRPVRLETREDIKKRFSNPIKTHDGRTLVYEWLQYD